jgi:hypothetical protein
MATKMRDQVCWSVRASETRICSSQTYINRHGKKESKMDASRPSARLVLYHTQPVLLPCCVGVGACKSPGDL